MAITIHDEGDSLKLCELPSQGYDYTNCFIILKFEHFYSFQLQGFGRGFVNKIMLYKIVVGRGFMLSAFFNVLCICFCIFYLFTTLISFRLKFMTTEFAHCLCIV